MFSHIARFLCASHSTHVSAGRQGRSRLLERAYAHEPHKRRERDKQQLSKAQERLLLHAVSETIPHLYNPLVEAIEGGLRLDRLIEEGELHHGEGDKGGNKS